MTLKKTLLPKLVKYKKIIVLPVRTIASTIEPPKKSQNQNGIQIQLLTAQKANTGETRVD